VGSENETLEKLSNLNPNRAQFDCPSISAHHDLLRLVVRVNLSVNQRSKGLPNYGRKKSYKEKGTTDAG